MLPERLNNLFAKRGGDLLILVFSLLLAFFMWGMHRFTQKYSTFFDYKIPSPLFSLAATGTKKKAWQKRHAEKFRPLKGAPRATRP